MIEEVNIVADDSIDWYQWWLHNSDDSSEYNYDDWGDRYGSDWHPFNNIVVDIVDRVWWWKLIIHTKAPFNNIKTLLKIEINKIF